MGPQVRMAASPSINKRKTDAADASQVIAAFEVVAACRAQARGGRRAAQQADCIAAATFTVLPDGGPMDLPSRRVNGPRRDAANGL